MIKAKLPWRFSDLRIGAKLGVLLATAAAPFALMTYLFLAQASKDVAFARLELRGVDYLQALTPTVNSLAQRSSGGLDAGLIDQARQLGQSFNAVFQSEAAVTQFLEAAARPDRLLALEAARAAVHKIADGANLTLDPKIESNYLVDVVVARVPELVVATVGLRRTLAYYVRSGRADLPEFSELIAALDRFGRAREAMQASLLTALARIPNDATTQDLKGASETFLRLAHRLSSAAGNAQTAIESDVPVRGAAEIMTLADEVLDGGFSISALTQAELARLLSLRVATLETDMRLKLTVVAGFFALALLLGVLILSSINGPVGGLVTAIRRFQTGDYDTAIPHTDSRDELGEIARALKSFQSMGAHQALTTAIESSTTMLMVTTPDATISFMSRGLRGLLHELAPALRAGDEAFSTATLLGARLERLLGNSAIKSTLLEGDDEAHTMRCEIADRTVDITTSAIRNRAGELIGQTLHWHDVTAELAAEHEIAAVVQAASRGEFDMQIELAGKSGAGLDIAQGLNQISTTVRNAALDFAASLNSIAHGDLTRQIAGTYSGLFGSLGDAINETGARLAETVVAIQATAQDAAQTTEDLRERAYGLAAQAEKQANALVQTAATSEELAASVKTSALAAQNAASRAEQAKILAERGGAIANAAVTAISRIEEMSQRINAISAMIDGIAFQTNLLALNAAVEAARAGESGKGFAVVASEVRTLAQRSGQAAKDISALLATSSREVATGVKLVRSAGASLEEIVTASQQLAGAVAEIATASTEQAAGIEEMSQAMDEVDHSTQRTAALADESLAAATRLTEQMHQFAAVVATFATQADGEPAGAPALDRFPKAPQAA